MHGSGSDARSGPQRRKEVQAAYFEEWSLKKEADRQLDWAMHYAGRTALTHLSLMLAETGSPAEGLDSERTRAIGRLLDRLCLLHERRRIRGGFATGQAPLERYPWLALIQLAWWLDRGSMAQPWLDAQGASDLPWEGSEFWTEYARALAALHRREPYVVPTAWRATRLAGYEKYWSGYLPLIQGISRQEVNIAQARALETAFVQRNQDRKLRDDALEIEGSGHYPLRWDFRLAALRAVAAQLHGLAF